MSPLIEITDLFWKWTGYPGSWKDINNINFVFDPLYFPEFEKLRNTCISSINCTLSYEEISAFLLCMALDSEDECILDACKERADAEFLSQILLTGISHPSYEVRWQMAELLRKDVPNRVQYIKCLLSDSNAYVRKRAQNVALENEIK